MNGPFVVAQAGSNANSGSAPVQIIKLTKPEAGHTEIFHASFNGAVKIDFTAIANEKITLFHDSKTQSLHIIFADGSQDIIEPFFDSRGTILGNLLLEMGPNVVYGGEQFAQTFVISEDPSLLPAAGPGGVAAGADFHGPVVDPFGLTNPLDLLPPEVLPGITFTGTEAPAFIEESNTNLPATVFGHVFGVVEEEQLNAQIIEQPSDSGQGNEDTRDVSGNDHDTSNSGPGSQITTQTFSGTLAGLVTGDTFFANSAANGTTVHDSNGNPLTSIGQIVHYVFVDASDIEGRTTDNRLIFTLHVNTDGTFTFTLNDQIDHPLHSQDFSHGNPIDQGAQEETLNLDLSTAVVAHDATPTPVVFPTNTFDIGVIDDTPIAFDSLPNYPQPYGGEGSGTFSQALDDENQKHGIQGGPGDDGFGKSLNGVLDFRPGADNYNSVSFGTNLNVHVTDGVNTQAVDQLQAIYVDSNGVGHKENVNVTWTPDAFGGGALTGSTTDIATVFTLTVDKFGDYTFCLNAPLAHTFTADPNQPGTTEFEDNLNIAFTYTVTDGDGDQALAFLTINVDDDVPHVADNYREHAQAAVTLDESVGNDASNPGDPNGALDDTGNPAPTFPLPTTPLLNPLPFGSATIDSSIIGGLFTAKAGADGEGSHAYTFALTGADGEAASIGATFVQTNLSITDFTATGNPTPVYGDDTIYLVQVSNTQINGLVAGVDGIIGNADDQLALRFIIDPSTGSVTVEQYLAIHHNDAGDTPAAYDDPAQMFVVGEGESGGIFVNYSLTDGDGDTASATSSAPISVTIQDDGIAVDVAQAVTGEGSGTFVTLDTLVLDESIASDRGPDSNHDGSLDDNNVPPLVTSPSYITTANSTLAIGITSTPTTVSGSGTSIADLFTVTKTIGSDGLENESKVYSLTLTDANGDPVLSGSGTGVLTNLHVTNTDDSPVDGTTEDHRAIWLFKVSDTEIVGLMGHDTPGDATDDFVALRIELTGNPADPVLQVEQYLPLEHPLTGSDHFDESVLLNFAIVGEGGHGGSLGVTLTDTVTDGDGDTATGSQTVTLATAGDSETSSGTSLITFEDDGPSASFVINSGVTLAVDETDGGLAPGEVDPIGGNLGTNTISGALLFTNNSVFGTDGPNVTNEVAYSLTVQNPASGLTDTLTGDAVTLHTISTTEIQGWDSVGDVVFDLSINSSTGDVTLTQFRAVVHADATNPDLSEPAFLADNTVGVTLTVTDGDGDTSSATANLNHVIEFLDDGPKITSAFSSGTVIQDETAGVQTTPDPNAQNDVAGSGLPSGVLALFNAITNKGVDPDVSPKDNNAIGFATSSSPIIFATADFGSDGPAVTNSKVLALAINGGNGADSGLQTTDGHEIFLFKEGSLIVGRYDGDSSGTVTDGFNNSTHNPDGSFVDPAAFAVAIGQDGNISLAQYVSLKNPIPGSTDAAHDEPTTGLKNIQVSVTVTDGDGDQATQTVDVSGNIAFQDDAPAPVVDTATVQEGGTGTTNFLITMDTSFSMNLPSGVAGFATKLDLEKAALINLLNSTNVNQVYIDNFGTIAHDSGGWLSKSAAIAFINGIAHGIGSTNFDAALADAENAFTLPHTGADQTLAYFLSDGVPNLPVGSVGIDAAEQATWENFLTTNGILDSFAVGISSNATIASLDPIAFPNGNPNNPLILTDPSQLSATLINSLPGDVSGNVLANDSFGADGPGPGSGIVSILVDGHLYAYDVGSNAITKDGNPFASGTSTLDLNTTLGGHFDFHFASGGGFNAGDYDYKSPPNVNTDTVESFHYVIADGDGDTSAADLNITVTAVNDPPVAHDDTVITNIAGSPAAIGIPDLALLLNDTDVDGPALSVLSTGVANSGSAGHAGTTTTFTDDNGDGGSFDYTIEDNGTPNLTSTAHVTIDRAQAGSIILNGTSANEILIGTTSDDTLIGNGGSDILVGNGGANHFLYNATTDGGTIANQAGADHILDFNNAAVGGNSIDVSASAFGLAVGDATGIFGSSANDNFGSPTERFHFNTSTHTLLYDSNGSTAGGTQVALAVLEHAATVDATHIHAV